ncbi:hypothetical protein [Vibrio vulnificus]|uniref:hypothetical protein n=1 Tax=Vibrio vulnificus TaxID=672 RepID=UPI000720AAA5|nr:hypothetical protein [Vibrio vulnificus]ALM70717.1 hypothetical protein FORC9_1200 [Vibrio vulnificus]ANH63477.1 hypothetical protein FORC16_1594 [Vibrio vulnificus]HAS6194965.1 hypothetical protein [Vibrio vulnificus]
MDFLEVLKVDFSSIFNDGVARIVTILDGTLSILVLLIGAILAAWKLYDASRSKKNERINRVFQKYCETYKNDGYRLKCLIPSGIHTLKSDSEVKVFFNLVLTIEPKHPLRHWDSSIQRIGYKKFFDHVFQSGKVLTKYNIDKLIAELEPRI